MTNLIAALTIFALLGSGLVAGTFFAFSTFIMPALADRNTDQALPVMQEINVVVLRSPFIAIFIGTAIASLILFAYALYDLRTTGSYFILSASATYLVLVFGITAAFNVPLNNKLASVESGEMMSEAAWKDYLDAWTRWNHVRTIGGIVSTLLFASSMLY